MTEGTRPQAEASVPGVAHDTRDISLKGIAWFIVALTLSMAGVFLFLIWLFDVLNAQAAREDVIDSAVQRTKIVPPEPRLQPNPAEELAALRKREDELLHPPAAEGKQPQRLAIEDAMHVLAERGIEHRAWPPSKQSTPPQNGGKENGTKQDEPKQPQSKQPDNAKPSAERGETKPETGRSEQR